MLAMQLSERRSLYYFCRLIDSTGDFNIDTDHCPMSYAYLFLYLASVIGFRFLTCLDFVDMIGFIGRRRNVINVFILHLLIMNHFDVNIPAIHDESSILKEISIGTKILCMALDSLCLRLWSPSVI